MAISVDRLKALLAILSGEETKKLEAFVKEVEKRNADMDPDAFHRVRAISFEIYPVRVGKFGGNTLTSPCIATFSIPVEDMIACFQG